MPAVLAVDVLRRADQAASLFSHPLRLKLLEQLIEPDSASGLARKLGVPRQVLNYHLKALEAAGLLQFVVERPRGGLKERVMRAAASAFLISPEVMGGVAPDPKRLQDRFSWAYLIAAAARIVRDLGHPARPRRSRCQATRDVHAGNRSAVCKRQCPRRLHARARREGGGARGAVSRRTGAAGAFVPIRAGCVPGHHKDGRRGGR